MREKLGGLLLVGLVSLSLLLWFSVGCNSDSALRTSSGASAKAIDPAPVASESDDPGINLQCAADRLRKAPAPFHWSFKKIVTPYTNADWEADVTADEIGGTLIDSFGTRAIHGVRSDQTSWNTAVMILSGPLPSSTFALVDNSSATTRADADNRNTTDAIKYIIDTSKDTASEASLIRTVLGPNGFVKGMAWVTRHGCPVRFVLDVVQHNKDGSVNKEHYELNLTTH